MRERVDPDGLRLPIKIDSASNGEYAPIPLEPQHQYARKLALENATGNARRTAQSRREFLVSACGAATTLLALNEAYAQVGKTGATFALPKEAALEHAAAASVVEGTELIFDVQGHFVNPTGAWTRKLEADAKPLSFTRTPGCAARELGGARDHLQCLGPDAFIRDVFLDSDTDLAVLSFVPSTRDKEPLTIEEAAATRAIVERMQGTHRLLLHGRVNPNQPGDVEDMERLASEYRIAAWKCYTQWGPDGKGFYLDDDIGIAMIERARALGIRNIAVHKGLPFGRESYEHSTCVDIGRIAKRFPDVNFLVYHSGLVPDVAEGPYDAQRSDGIDSLVTSVRKAGLGHGSNVFAELGSTWRLLMRDPDSAAHALGKLLTHLGEDNILWGTDSIWYGSPQDQIQAFRAFRISDEYRERFEYPELTASARAKVFGRNALRIYPVPEDVLRTHLPSDAVAMERAGYAERRDPAFTTYGPKTRREFLHFKSLGG